MGGMGSGAQRSTNIGNVEDAIALDIRVLRRVGVVRPGECVIDEIHWSKRGLRTASARLRVDLSDIEHGGGMLIVADMPGGTITQQIAIDGVPSTFGGHRCYFICPITATRCEILYYLEDRFASRQAQRLGYAVQGMTDLSRARRKVAKLRSRLQGGDGLPRPRGRKRTKVVMRLDDAEHMARAVYLKRLRKWCHPERGVP